MNPVEDITDHRNHARSEKDANADICFLSIADTDGKASIRTLVMRDITRRSFFIFISKSSPKWQALFGGVGGVGGGSWQLLLWYPSQQKQYRISGSQQIMDEEVVRNNWEKRPHGSKMMDLIYEYLAPQSSIIESRDELTGYVREMETKYQTDNLKAPLQVAGAELIANTIERLDLSREDRIHDRRLFTWTQDQWHESTLIP